MSKTYASLVCGTFCVLAGSGVAEGQAVTADASRTTCAALLASDVGTPARAQPSPDPARRPADTAAQRTRSDTASVGIGGARTGPGDIILRAAVQAEQLRFGAQPRVRVRLCWAGDTLRVVQRDNLPSPVVAGTTYRNVYVAVELIGRLNAECLADRIGVRDTQPRGAAQQAKPAPSPGSLGACAFLGAAAATGAQTPRPPNP
jgi:hypothetical protein